MATVYLITGASGHLGNTLIQKLLAQGERVRALVLENDGLARFLPDGAERVCGNVSDPDSLEEFFASDGDELIVIHCAGIVDITSGMKKKTYEVNVGGTKNIVDLCVKHQVKKLVYVSSVHALPVLPKGTPMAEIGQFAPRKVKGWYAKTKAEATAYVLEAASKGLDVSIVHPSGIIGPFDNGLSPMTELFLSLGECRLPAGVTGGYDFVDVRDVADGIISCCISGRKGECYILSGGYITVPEIIKTIAETIGVKAPGIVPMALAKCAAPFFELAARIGKKRALFTPYSLYTLSSNALFSHSKAEKELGYRPRPFRETVTDTVAWLRQRKRMKALRA